MATVGAATQNDKTEKNNDSVTRDHYTSSQLKKITKICSVIIADLIVAITELAGVGKEYFWGPTKKNFKRDVNDMNTKHSHVNI